MTRILSVNGDNEDNIFVFGNSLATIANGGAGEDYYLYRAGQQGRVTISDYSSSNQLYFDVGVTITDANISRSQLHIRFQGIEDTLRLSNFSSYRFFIDSDEDGLSHTQFLARANSGNGIRVTVPVELPPIIPASESTVEIRANGTTDADTFSLGYDLRAELNGGAGRDTFEITRYQTNDVEIRDFSVNNLIRFESGVDVANLEINRGTFEISLENGATVSVMIGSLQKYQLGEGSIMEADEFIAALAPPEITIENQVTTLAEDIDFLIILPDASDIDEIAPVINDATVSIAENAMLGAEVYDVNNADGDDSDADDADGQALQYSITAGNTDNAFAINQGTGVITVADPSQLDFETTVSYTLTVEASDGTATETATITVNVSNIDEISPVINDATVSIAENAMLGAEVYDVNNADGDDSDADDADGQALQYSIAAGNTGNAFAINQGTGVITVADPSQLDFETTVSYTLIVEASDGTADSIQMVTVNITDENEDPTISNTIPSQVLADEPITINLADFSATQMAISLSYTVASDNENIVTAMIADSTLTLTDAEGSALVNITVTARR